MGRVHFSHFLGLLANHLFTCKVSHVRSAPKSTSDFVVVVLVKVCLNGRADNRSRGNGLHFHQACCLKVHLPGVDTTCNAM